MPETIYSKAGADAATAAAIAAHAPRLLGRSLIAQDVARRLAGVKVVLILRHDDLQPSVMDYLPVYAAHGVLASFFVVPAQVGDGSHLTLAQLRAIRAAGHDIGSHGMNHRQADALTLTADERHAELRDSKAWLENALGDGYVCETTAYPGNIPVYDNEVFEYYEAGFADSGSPALKGPIDLARHPASMSSTDWFDDASSAANIAKINARIATLKARSGGAIDVIQAHNTGEMSAAQLGELLTIVAADPEVAILTASEWVHYVKERYWSPNGRHYVAGPRYFMEPRAWNSTSGSSGAFMADRRGSGIAFRAAVNGVEVMTLDNHLALLTPGTSRMDKGHVLRFSSVDNSAGSIKAEDGGYLTINPPTAGTLLIGGKVRLSGDGAGLTVRTAGGAEALVVDTTRQTLRLANRAALPTGASVVGEICIVLGVLNICTVAGTPGTWVAVGAQT